MKRALLLSDKRRSAPGNQRQPILALNLKRYTHALLLAIKTREDWFHNPSESYVIAPESTLVFMTTPEGRRELAGFLKDQ